MPVAYGDVTYIKSFNWTPEPTYTREKRPQDVAIKLFISSTFTGEYLRLGEN
ncbi:Uncharacterized protein APZ42_024289 [Daphnia magna]|uniref:Uncharacterized protein n=1 Tax=Daphnia magna TaxID=35525 RepID=A0A162F5Q1_9CRUS|nr:Uncharacterized protein APZ42_024289 [Daphnia magna]